MMMNTIAIARYLWFSVLLVCCAARAEVPKWVVYPDKDWKTLTPLEAGITDIQAWNEWVQTTEKSVRGSSFHGEDHGGNEWGVAITRGGYLIQTFGDPDYKYQSASVGKCFTMACLQLAIDEGRIKSADDLIKDYWTGNGQLNAHHKYLDQGHHVFLTFNHLKRHRGAFAITNGWSWRSGTNYGKPAPKWSKWTGDPDKDNYAHAKPGTVGSTYSSGGYWRLAQALTAVWQKDLKQVLDERIMSKIGIPADAWDWIPGQVVHDNQFWYPKMPGYGGFLDPPYTIDGQLVRGGPGWVVMSAKDLARWGLLVASGGQWNGKRLISGIQGHGGGNGSHAGGTGGDVFGSWGRVTSTFNQGSIPWKLFNKPPKPGTPSTAQSNAETARPNIILCMADDQGWGDVGYYRKSVARTPVLDRMAASGLRLDRFYAAAPVCSPTRGSVLTGRHPNRFACFSWGHSLRPEEVTIAEVLKQAGYATGHFGKWHLGSVDARSDVSPGASGFDHWFSSANFFENDPLMSDNGRVVHTKGESSEVTMNAAMQFVRDCAAKKQPFLAVVWFGSPHGPHIALDRDRELYAGQPEKIQHYYGEITGIDRSMGTLRDELRRLGIADNTLLWYTSDNGPQGPRDRGRPGSSGGLRDRKGTVWEGGIRVPTIIEWPVRIPTNRITSVACGTVDIYPTLLDIVGADIHEDDQPRLDGISILPLIDGQMTERSKPMGFWSYPTRGTGMNSTRILEELQQAQTRGQTAPLHNDKTTRDARAADATKAFSSHGYTGHAAWIDNRYKLHRIWDRKTAAVTYELYDLIADAAESHDLADKQPKRLATMKRQLQQWQQSVVHGLEGKDYQAGPIREEGFISLFDGQTLNGWQGATEHWAAENGALVFIRKGAARSKKELLGLKLMSNREYSDFILRFDIKLPQESNNGVAIRAPLEGDPAFVGMEIQVQDPQYYRALKDYEIFGSIYGVAPAKVGHLKPNGQWNTEEILCIGRHVKVTLNGTVIVGVHLDFLGEETIDGANHPGLSREKGHIGFCGHTGRVAFRNIRIKDLSGRSAAGLK